MDVIFAGTSLIPFMPFLPSLPYTRLTSQSSSAAYSVYYCTVIGWSGSLVFERDLRRHAKNLDLKFDSSGITNRTDSSPVLVDPAEGEKGVFERLGLEWLEPWERCADI